eukprot:195269_1
MEPCAKLEQCICVERIIKAMKYYDSLNLDDGKSRDLLVKFCTGVYKLLLDDFIHIVTKHNNEIEDFKMPKCNFVDCDLLDRHNRTDRNYTHDQTFNSTQDKNVIFYIDLMDSIHCYLMHLYDVGLRIKQNEHKDDLDDTKSDTEYFDASFSNICKQIEKNENKLKANSFDNNRLNSEKFNIIYSKNELNQTDKGETFIDGLFEWIHNDNVVKNKLYNLKTLIENEEYDTDVLLYDMCTENDMHCNMANILCCND